MRILKAGGIYFLLMFAVGWILGPIRVLWAIPRFGPLPGMLLEAVVMSLAMIIAARWAIRRFDVGTALAPAISMGLIAFGCLIPAEISGALLIRGIPLKEYLGTFLTPTGGVALLMFLIFAAMPTVVSGLGNRRKPAGRRSGRPLSRA